MVPGIMWLSNRKLWETKWLLQKTHGGNITIGTTEHATYFYYIREVVEYKYIPPVQLWADKKGNSMITIK